MTNRQHAPRAAERNAAGLWQMALTGVASACAGRFGQELGSASTRRATQLAADASVRQECRVPGRFTSGCRGLTRCVNAAMCPACSLQRELPCSGNDQVIVQIELEGGWKDCSTEEKFPQLAAGVTRDKTCRADRLTLNQGRARSAKIWRKGTLCFSPCLEIQHYPILFPASMAKNQDPRPWPELHHRLLSTCPRFQLINCPLVSSPLIWSGKWSYSFLKSPFTE